MVEGPGCTLNGEKLRTKVQKGQKVVEMRARAGAALSVFVGCVYSGVQSLGKELFIYFGFRALRVHFGMHGSMRINPTERRDSQGSPPALLIILTKDTICFYDSTVEIRLTEDCEEKVRVMACLDVCSQCFSMPRAVEVVCKESGRMLCDVLLDQAVLPGVGNIIKNEALFNSGLNPAVKVKQLTTAQVQHVVKMTRDFTLLFYQCRKRGSALQRHCKVYKRSRCAQCDGAVTVCRMGNDSRMTYFCPQCQSEDPGEDDVSKLPVRSTLLGWACQRDGDDSDQVARKEEEEWACDLCTLINRPLSKSCEACLSPRPESAREWGETPPTSPLIRFPCNAFTKPQQELKLHRRAAFGNTTLVLTDLSPKPSTSALSPAAGGRGLMNTLPGERRSMGIGSQPASASPQTLTQPCKRRRTETGADPAGVTQNSRQDTSRGTQGHSTPLTTTPCCPTHRRPAVLRVVTKAGENKGRQFYTCSLPRGAQCNYFEWADLHFPTCHHGKRTLMRTVLKLGPNNGRNFYVCPLKQGTQCDFFQWAENGPGGS